MSSTITAFSLLGQRLHGNTNKPYGRVVHPANDDDDEDGLFNRKSHNDECCRSESSFGGMDAGLDDDHDHTDEDNMVEVGVANEIEEEADMVGLSEE